MKRIGIDARLYSQTGVGIYIQNLLHHLPEFLPVDMECVAFFSEDDKEKITIDSSNIKKVFVSYPWHSLSEQSLYPFVLHKHHLDLMHFTYFSYPVLYQKKFIATVHDLTPYLFKTGKASTKNPLFYALKHSIFSFVLKNQIDRSEAIITPTQTVKNQIVSTFGVKPDKVHSIYEGVDNQLAGAQENASLKKQFPFPFFIYVGNFYPHKNVERLISAFSQLHTDAKLILVGPRDYFANKTFQLINQLKCDKKILFYHNSSNEDRVFFYKNAKALVHPSLSEGFGLPIVEAMNFNLPVIASNIDVFKELLGDSYLSFNPEEIKEIKDSIEVFLEKKPAFDYSNLMKKFSFRQMTKETVELYKQML